MSGARGAEAARLARGWIGTPYRHQASCRGGGADCLGLIRGIWRELYVAEPEPVPAYTADWAEPAGRELLLAAAGRWLRAVPSSAPDAPGQVLLFRMREAGVAKHLGILSESGPQARFIHAYGGHGVLECSLSVPWLRRVVARFEFP